MIMSDTDETKISLENYTKLLNERANLKARIEVSNDFKSLEERSTVVERYKRITSGLNKLYIEMKGL
jgi:hypothetical protein